MAFKLGVPLDKASPIERIVGIGDSGHGKVIQLVTSRRKRVPS